MTAITFAGKYFSDALLLKSHDIDDDDQRYEHRAVTSDVETDAISSDCSQGMKMPIATLPPGQSRPRLRELEGVSIPSFNICVALESTNMQTSEVVTVGAVINEVWVTGTDSTELSCLPEFAERYRILGIAIVAPPPKIYY